MQSNFDKEKIKRKESFSRFQYGSQAGLQTDLAIRVLEESNKKKPSSSRIFYIALQRIIGAFCLFLAVFYWMKLIGLSSGEAWLFDIANPVSEWFVWVVLAIFLPFAATGLWMGSSWGGVIWVLCGSIEIIMYIVSGDFSTHQIFFMFLHFLFFVNYFSFSIIFYNK